MSAEKVYPFKEYAWDDDPSNDDGWVDSKEAKKYYDGLRGQYEMAQAEIHRLKGENERLKEFEWKYKELCK